MGASSLILAGLIYGGTALGRRAYRQLLWFQPDGIVPALWPFGIGALCGGIALVLPRGWAGFASVLLLICAIGFALGLFSTIVWFPKGLRPGWLSRCD
jgi:hypothetical protein